MVVAVVFQCENKFQPGDKMPLEFLVFIIIITGSVSLGSAANYFFNGEKSLKYVVNISSCLFLILVCWFIISCISEKQVLKEEFSEVYVAKDIQIAVFKDSQIINLNSIFKNVLPKDAKIKKITYKKFYYGIYWPVEPNYETCD